MIVSLTGLILSYAIPLSHRKYYRHRTFDRMSAGAKTNRLDRCSLIGNRGPDVQSMTAVSHLVVCESPTITRANRIIHNEL